VTTAPLSPPTARKTQESQELKIYNDDIHSLPYSTKKNFLLNFFYVSNRLFFAAVYILAKQHGVKNPESFGLLLAEHFLNKVR